MNTGFRSQCVPVLPYNRNGQDAMRLEGNKVHFGLGTDLLKTYDLNTGERPIRIKLRKLPPSFPPQAGGGTFMVLRYAEQYFPPFTGGLRGVNALA